MSAPERGVPTSSLDLEDIDEWAVNLVVKEGVRMHLNYCEQVVAAIRMAAVGMGEAQIADRLRISRKEARTLFGRHRRLTDKLRQQLSV